MAIGLGFQSDMAVHLIWGGQYRFNRQVSNLSRPPNLGIGFSRTNDGPVAQRLRLKYVRRC